MNQKGIMIDYKGAAFNAIETEFLGTDEVLSYSSHLSQYAW